MCRRGDRSFSPFLPSHGHLSGTPLYTTGGASQSVPSAGYLSPITPARQVSLHRLGILGMPKRGVTTLRRTEKKVFYLLYNTCHFSPTKMIKFQFINLSEIAEMSVLIGAPVWLGNRPFKQTLSALQEAGFDYLEFSLDFPLPECMRSEEKEELKRMLEDFGLKIAFHSPLDVQAVHPRREIFEASMKVLRKCFEFSSYFSPLYYNLHLHPRISTLKLDEVRGKVRARYSVACH